MAITYFVGGAPRTGKTTVVQEMLKRKTMLAASTDAVRAVAKKLVNQEANPQLHKVERGVFGSEKHKLLMRDEPLKALKYEIAEAEQTWRSVVDFLSYYQRDGRESVVEGVAVLPEQLAKSSLEFKSVFIVNLHDQTDEILAHARGNSFDWLSKYDDETIRLYALFNQHWNKYYANEAERCGLPVVEINPKRFDECLSSAVDILLN